MIRAFPESCFIIFTIGDPILVTAPIPFALFVVYDMINNILPATAGDIECCFIAEVLVKVNMTYYVFTQHPLLTLIIYKTCIRPSFVCHQAICLQTFICGFGYEYNGFFHLRQHLWFI